MPLVFLWFQNSLLFIFLGLSKHLITHPEYRNDPNFKGAELFNCPVCEKFFTRENYLERHMEMKHDEEHSRAYEIYKQKYIRKPKPVIEGNTLGQSLPILEQSSLPTDDRVSHVSPNFATENQSGHVQEESFGQRTMTKSLQTVRLRSEIVSKGVKESPCESELEDSIQRRQQHEHIDANRSILTSQSESFQSDASFERSSPNRAHISPVTHSDSVGNWPDSNSSRASPRGFAETQHQPYDMSQRQDLMPPSKSENVQVRSASVSLPVFPEPFDRHLVKENKSTDESTRGNAYPSYLHRQMASLDEDHLKPSGNFLQRQISVHQPQLSYEQFVRDHLIDDNRTTSEKNVYERNSHIKEGAINRNEHYTRTHDNYFSHHRENDGNVGHVYVDRNKSMSKNNSPDSNTQLSTHDDRTHEERHFPYSRSSIQDHHSKLMHGNEDSRYDYQTYNTHGLLSPGHGGFTRDRLSGQFPFNLPPSSLPPTSFPHAMSPRPSLVSQYPPLSHRSEEEVAQALESLARVMRPAFR